MSVRYAHTNIICQDWRTLAAFYKEVFGCEFVPPKRNQSGDWLERGTGVKGAALEGVHLRLPGHGKSGPTLEIYQYTHMEDAAPPAANRKGIGHLAFEVSDVAATLETILIKGGKPLGQIVTRNIPRAGEITFVYATDPEGNILELQSWG